MATYKQTTALVLEGGGMRGIYTAGVLDCFTDYNVHFSYVIGTSAGATTGINYLSRQKGRSHFCDTDLIRLHNYIGLMPMVGGHGVIDMDFLFETFPNEYYPFDFETYCQSGSRMIMVTSNALTGKAEYIEEYANYKRFVDAARASCSLPIMCPMGNVDGIPMVDGGVTDSIPFAHALSDGCTKAVVVMTKEVGYRKEAGDIYLPPMAYRKYPELREALRTRNDAYNAQLDALTQAEQSGQAYVIRPTHNCGVGRTTSDISKLEQLYDLGYNMALQQLNNINQFIGN